jgi:hypothetical protein
VNISFARLLSFVADELAVYAAALAALARAVLHRKLCQAGAIADLHVAMCTIGGNFVATAVLTQPRNSENEIYAISSLRRRPHFALMLNS